VVAYATLVAGFHNRSIITLPINILPGEKGDTERVYKWSLLPEWPFLSYIDYWRLFLFVIFYPSMVFSTYTLFFSKGIQKEKLNWRRIANPVLVATIVGLVIGLVSVRDYIPDFLITIVTMVGAIATPLFMLILGGNIFNDFMYKADNNKKWYIWEVVKFVVIKNIVFPLIFLALLLWLRPDSTIALIVILQAAVPPITAIPILVERCGGNRKIASQFVVASFIFSIVSIPAFIYLFNRFFPIPF
jgi:hypothetical protein